MCEGVRMVLTLLLLVPLSAGLLCLATRSRAWWERLNLLAFAIVAGLAVCLGLEVAAQGAHGTVTALDGFLRADALSALVIGLTAFVALVCAIYAVGYFRRDLKRGPDHRGAIAALLRADAAVRVRDAAGAAGGQPGGDVGGDREHHAGLRAAGHLLQSEDLVRGGLEIHHHRQRRHFPGACSGR